jgi:peptide/nickel transport system permease protein
MLRGLPRRTVVWEYGVRNAAIPIVSACALTLIHLTGVAIIVENVFSVPGVGQALVQSVSSADAPMVQAVVLLFAVFIVGVFLASDLLAEVLNPRRRERSV